MHRDLWLAASDGLSTFNDGIPKFDSSGAYALDLLSRCVSFVPALRLTASSTFEDLNATFSITYGSGAARGTLGQDVVRMAGFEVNPQIFGKRCFCP